MEIFEPTSSGAHVSDTTADNTTVKEQDAPAGARGFVLSVKSRAIYITLDGSTPSSTNGLYCPAETMPIFLPLIPANVSSKQALKWISSDAAGSTVDILWVR